MKIISRTVKNLIINKFHLRIVPSLSNLKYFCTYTAFYLTSVVLYKLYKNIYYIEHTSSTHMIQEINFFYRTNILQNKKQHLQLLFWHRMYWFIEPMHGDKQKKNQAQFDIINPLKCYINACSYSQFIPTTT